MKKEIIISEDDDGRKIGKIIKINFPSLPLGNIFKLFRRGDVKINGKKSKAEDEVKVGDTISVYTKEKSTPKEKQNIQVSENFFKEKFNIIFEDKDLLIINKPAGLAVHPGTKHYQGRTMIDLAEHYLEKEGKLFVQLVHRLDADTSGALVFAKNGRTLRAMNELISKGEMKKKYYALVFGNIKKESGEIKTEVEKIKGSKFNKMKIVPKKTKDSKTSVTVFTLKERYKNLSLLDIDLQTGRMHQIRVHMKSTGHPLVMDKMYGDFEKNKQFKKDFGLKRQFLHAYYLEFIHPHTGKQIKINAEINTDLKKCLGDIKLS